MALKARLYLAAGAIEVWIVSEDGAWQIDDAQGAQAKSRYPVQLALPSIPAG